MPKFAYTETRQQLLADLQDIEDRAHREGMTLTAKGINRAKNAAGWEITGDSDSARKALRG